MGSTCPECSDTFDSEYGMKIHYGSSHEGSLAGIQKECDNCGEITDVLPHNARRNENFFCDKGCHGEWLSENRTRENHPNFNSIEVECEFCNRSFLREKNQEERSEKFFCDLQCRSSWQSENSQGEDNPNFKHGETIYYGKNWSEQREKAIERDFHACRMCRMTESECLNTHGCGLHVHHKIPFRTFKEPEEANVLWNLITYCPSCHQLVESNSEPSPLAQSV